MDTCNPTLLRLECVCINESARSLRFNIRQSGDFAVVDDVMEEVNDLVGDEGGDNVGACCCCSISQCA